MAGCEMVYRALKVEETFMAAVLLSQLILPLDGSSCFHCPYWLGLFFSVDSPPLDFVLLLVTIDSSSL